MATTSAAREYYLYKEKFPKDEDDMHEWKLHRSISTEDVPDWCLMMEKDKVRRSRQPVSKTICAFLNSAKGGIVYLGVKDNGRVYGLKLTQFQKDHVIVDLHDTISRFTPPVPPHMLRVKFVPVLDSRKGKVVLTKDPDEQSKDRLEKVHKVRNSGSYCWCDIDCQARCNKGVVVPSCVVEIVVMPWDGKGDGTTRTPLPPIYQTESGLCFFRCQASNVQRSIQEVLDVTVNQIHNYHVFRNEERNRNEWENLLHDYKGLLVEIVGAAVVAMPAAASEIDEVDTKAAEPEPELDTNTTDTAAPSGTGND